ncbi:oligosaccharide flippase family protein, partial [Flavobacteriaceae bacterium]|nr:oligosaccharide flippase family protein [Flavobacteriaceae bacterium]
MDVKSKALLQNTIIYTIGNMGSKLLSFGLLPIFSYYLTKEEFGYYDIVVTTITLLVPIITLQLSDAIFRWLIEIKNKKNEIASVVSNSFIVVVFNILLFIIIGIISSLFVKLDSLYLVLILLGTSSIFPMVQQTVRGLG